MNFEIIGELKHVEVIAVGRLIRELGRLRRVYGVGRWRKMKGQSDHPMVEFLRWSCIDMKMKSNPSTSTKKFALCLSSNGNPSSLEVFKVYRVLSPHKKHDPQDIRVIDESGEDYLYPRENFLPIKLPAKAVKRAQVSNV
jgi:hypothetical protein